MAKKKTRGKAKAKTPAKSRRLNTDIPAPRQIWEHYKTGLQLLIINIKNDSALCAVLDHAGVSSRRVIIPTSKFMFWGNRGLFFVRLRSGKLPTPGKKAGVYSTRNYLLGAR